MTPLDTYTISINWVEDHCGNPAQGGTPTRITCHVKDIQPCTLKGPVDSVIRGIWDEVKGDGPFDRQDGQGGQLIIKAQLELAAVRVGLGQRHCNVQLVKIFSTRTWEWQRPIKVEQDVDIFPINRVCFSQ